MARKSDTYNSEPFGSPRKGEKRTFLGMLLVIILLALTMSMSVALCIAYLTPHVAPSTFGSLTIVGIFAPILYTGVAVCMLLWLVSGYWKIALIVAVLLLPGLFHFSDFYNIDFVRKVEENPSRRSFTLMSYNVRGFYDDSSRRAIDDYITYFSENELVDVMCFQEYALHIRGVERLDSLFRARYDNIYSNDVVEAGEVVLRTYSRFPIIASGNISGEGRGTSQWVDIVIANNDTLRVFNNHLHTMSISAVDSEDIADGRILQDGDRMRSIVERIANNSTIRAEYVDTLRKVIESSPYRNVICGDFNDTPMSYVYGEMIEDHVDAFVQSGSGYGYTFRPMYGTLRIDYIMHSPLIETESYVIDENAVMSDHLPVVARMNIGSR